MKEAYYKKQLQEEEKKDYEECVELLERGSRKKAAKKLEEFLAENPNFAPALNKKAVIHIYRKEYNKAQSLLNQILEQDPDFAPAITNLGSIAKEMGNLNRAKKLYQKAIDINEEYGPAYNNLGVIYREEGNYSESIKYLKKARKKGSFSYHLNADKPFYKDPGCLFVIFLVVSLIMVLYLLLT
ncbi:MAG: tetratricopeptide repeat protein [Halanaerobiales bacterium]|nr:tetratricopeptide repeat protein [Halanaerobiales bacterium]